MKYIIKVYKLENKDITIEKLNEYIEDLEPLYCHKESIFSGGNIIGYMTYGFSYEDYLLMQTLLKDINIEFCQTMEYC